MGGGLMQLVAYGAQDIYLTGNPQITFFKVVYRRHTNFSMEDISQTASGTVGFDQNATFTISRNGDLIHKMYFEFSPKNMFNNCNTGTAQKVAIASYVGNTLLKEVECEIGGQLIDRHYSHWLSTWADLTESNKCGDIAQPGFKMNSAANGLFEPGGMRTIGGLSTATTITHDSTPSNGICPNATFDAGAVVADNEGSLNPRGSENVSGCSPYGGSPTLFQKMSFNHIGVSGGSAVGEVGDEPGGGFVHASATFGSGGNFFPNKAYVPLRFWFNRNAGLALPLIALQYHEVKINMNFCSASDILIRHTDSTPSTEPTLSNGKLWVQYIYLDTDERKRFAQVSHEYLIEQLQFQTEGTGGNYELNFNHPVKEIIWGGKPMLPSDGLINGPNIGRVLGSGLLSPFKIDTGATVGKTVASGTGTITNGSTTYGGVSLNTSNGGTNGAEADATAPTWQLKLNGHDRFSERHTTYFSRQQIYDHHSGFGGVANRDCILVYSFALKPEEHQPSGTCNFSRIDTAQLIATENQSTITKGVNIYAINYNVLRIMSGMGGLAYSN